MRFHCSKFSGLSAQYNYRSGGDYGKNGADYMEYGGGYAEDQKDYGIGGQGTDYGNDWEDFAKAQLGIDLEDYGIADTGSDTASRDYSSFPGRQTLIRPIVERH